MKIILAISGYRNFNDNEIFIAHLDKFTKQYGKPDKIIFGDCRGTDELALKYAKSNNIKYEIFVAEWNKYGPKAGPIRNEKMINNATHLVAFLSKFSKGTLNTINLANNKKIKILVVNI